MGRVLSNADITHVSYVNKAANKKKFFLTKSAEAVEKELTFEKEVKIIKGDDDAQMLVYGVVYEPDVPDAHDDIMKAEEIEKAAHKFLKEYRQIDKQHDFTAGAGELVESYVAPADMSVNGELIRKGSWVIVTKATEEIWEAIQKGDITGYSMGGVAETEEIAKESLMDKIMKGLAATLEPILKGEVADAYNQHKPRKDLFLALELFENVVYNEAWKDKIDTKRIQDAAKDFANLLNTIATSEDVFKELGGKEGIEKARERKDLEPIEKAGKKISSARLARLTEAHAALGDILAEVAEAETKTEGEAESVTKEELQEVLKSALEPMATRLEALEKGDDMDKKKKKKAPGEEEEPEAGAAPVKKEEGLTAEVVKGLFSEALAPIEKRLETVEKARGIQKSEQADPEPEAVAKDEGPKSNFWGGLI